MARGNKRFVIGFVLAAGAAWLCIKRIFKIGENHPIVGVVKVGAGFGEQVGARTANLDVSLAKDILPGLYLCEVSMGGKVISGVLYYGYNSMTQKNCLEVHLLGFTGDIYGKEITVEIKKYLRRPKRFKTTEALREQIKKDLKLIKKII